jgi:hypothetical protein
VPVVTEAECTEASFARLLPRMDCAISDVGLLEQLAFDAGIFERVNLQLLQTFLRALERSALRRLVDVSTYDVFAAQGCHIRESHSIFGLDDLTLYVHAMTQAYTEATTFAERIGTVLTTIHPAALNGGLNASEEFNNVIKNLLN